MELLEFIEKYRVSNFETYLKDDATIQYWQNLIIEFTKDKNELNNTDIFFYRELKRPNETVFGISFGNFCREQIELIEIKNKFNLTTPEPTEYNKDHLLYFKPKGFELFDALYKRFRINTHNSQDLNFIYAQMGYDGFIIKEIPIVIFQEWLDSNYTLEEPYKIRPFLLSGKRFEKRFDIYEPIKNCM